MVRGVFRDCSETGPYSRRFVVADDAGVDGFAHVPRTGLRPILLLYFAAPSTPVPSSVGNVDVQTLYNNLPNCQQHLKTQVGVAFSAVR